MFHLVAHPPQAQRKQGNTDLRAGNIVIGSLNNTCVDDDAEGAYETRKINNLTKGRGGMVVGSGGPPCNIFERVVLRFSLSASELGVAF